MSNKYDYQSEKKQDFCVKVTTRIRGKLKNEFMNDVIHRDSMESKVSRSILEIYYSIMNERPDLKAKEFNEIKTEVLKRMRL